MRLRKAYVLNPCDNRLFIPRLKLEEICDKQAVAQELARVFPDRDRSSTQRHASLIYDGRCQDTSITTGPCLKIFVILVLLKKVKLIESFLKHSFCDDDLPFTSTTNFSALCSRRNGSTTYLKFPGEDDPYDIIKHFVENQWSVLAPSFNAPKAGPMRCNVYEFPEKTILPVEHISKKKYPGGFGLVEKVKIHKEHNGFVSCLRLVNKSPSPSISLTKATGPRILCS